MKTLLFIIGTRPEAIKLFSVIQSSQHIPHFITKVCITYQHKDLLIPLLKSFKIEVDYTMEDLSLDGTLSIKTALMLCRFEGIYAKCRPDLVIVQGDTLTAFVAALAAHYSKISVAHVEAGLRTDELFSPWPEESHRRMIDQLSSYFFVPTHHAKEALLKEGFSPKDIYIVGNTSIDALAYYEQHQPFTKKSLPSSIIVTVHRRENHGKPLENVCEALKTIGCTFPDVDISFFVHPNPAVQTTVKQSLRGIKNISLHPPSDHLSFIEFMKNASFILTDSGGIQEEATFFGIPVLIARNTTERPEGITAQTARLVGTCPKNIFAHCAELLTNEPLRKSMSKIHFPYGKGDSGKLIVQTLVEKL